MQILLKNGLLVDPSQKLHQELDILIVGSTIVKVGKNIKDPAEEVYNLKGKIVAPGFIDMHVHLREPGFEEKETIKTGARAAVAGGFTSIGCMANTNPVADDVSLIKHIKEVAIRNGIVNVLPIGACTEGLKGQTITQIGEMQRFGAVAFSDDGRPIENALVLRRLLEYAGMFKAIIILHCEDLSLSKNGSMNEGEVSTRLGLPGIPRSAESSAIARDLELAKNFGRVHIAHVSTKESVDIIRNAKKQGVKVTCETAPHYLTLTEDAVENYDTNAKMSPPLREEKDRLALIEGIKDGTIDIIATDHAPHTQDDKRVEFNLASNGIVGLETAVPLFYDKFVKTKQLTIDKMIDIMSCQPSKIFDLGKGTLEVGATADITVIDPKLTRIVDKTLFFSKGKNTPFNGWELTGWPVLTIVNGEVKHNRLK